MIFETIAIFAISLFALSKSSHWVIDSTIKLSEYLGISGISAGYIFIAFGTSLPDLMVSVQASLAGKSAIAFGDVLGSSIANICLVLGITAMLKPLYIRREHTLESAELLLIASFIPLLLLYLGGAGFYTGLFLLLVFLLYVFLVLKRRFTMDLPVGRPHGNDLLKQFAALAGGLAVLVVAAHFVIDSTVLIATKVGIPEALIGMTLIAFGTTLPELAVDFVAIRRGHTALALGDILGSSVINLTLVLGSALILSPVSSDLSFYATALVFLVVVNMFLWYMLMRHEGISKEMGAVLMLCYILFLTLEFLLAFGLVGRSPTGAFIVPFT